MYAGNMIQSGTYTVAATPAAVSIELGFRPSYVRAVNINTLTVYEYYGGMADASVVQIANHGTDQISVPTSNGITLDARGVTFGTGIGGTATHVVRWVAFR